MRYFFGSLFIIMLLHFQHGFGQIQTGKASYYAEKFKGRRTASGELYHPDSLTCAHRSYAFGTLLKISNPSKGTSVIVRVNDRGPFVKNRIVDLSGRAARKLEMYLQGVAEVEVEVYVPEEVVAVFPEPEPVKIPDKLVGRKVVIRSDPGERARRTYSFPERTLGTITNPAPPEAKARRQNRKKNK